MQTDQLDIIDVHVKAARDSRVNSAVIKAQYVLYTNVSSFHLG